MLPRRRRDSAAISQYDRVKRRSTAMAQEQNKPSGPDLSQGVAIADLAGGKLLGHVGDEDVLLVQSGDEIFAVGAHCTHYHGPLAEGLVTGESVRCPWHHACFDLRTGEAARTPALSPIACWNVERRDGRIVVKDKRDQPKPRGAKAKADAPAKIVILGGGAAGFAAAEMLRRRDYRGSIAMLSDDDAPPVDRPNLSKDYLAGSAPEDWLPLRPDEFYAGSDIDLRLKTSVAKIDARQREVITAAGQSLSYDRLLLATGAEPVRLNFPGADRPHVHALRSLGDFIRALHEEHGVVFHLQDTVTALDGKRAVLKSGGSLEADLVIVGVGVRPRLTLAEQAGLAVDRGLTVNEYLQTSAPNIYAAGDIARWSDPHSGERVRVEHWVVAQRQGQAAAANMLGLNQRFDTVPFFWSQHYDVPINYIGHAERWDSITIEGDVKAKDCLL